MTIHELIQMVMFGHKNQVVHGRTMVLPVILLAQVNQREEKARIVKNHGVDGNR